MMEFKNIWWPNSSQEDFDTWESKKYTYTCDLDKISQFYNCDKSNSQKVSKNHKNGNNDTELTTPGHNYTEVYNEFFNKNKNEKINILELGIGNYPTNGYSLQVWLDYFPNANITLLDWSSNNFKFDFEYDKSRVQFHLIDQNNEEELKDFSENHKIKYDIIIDDCSHQGDHQFNTFKYFFPNLLKNNGEYFIEDIHDNNFLNFIPIIYDSLNTGSFHYTNKYNLGDLGISEIRLFRSLIYIKKGTKITR